MLAMTGFRPTLIAAALLTAGLAAGLFSQAAPAAAAPTPAAAPASLVSVSTTDLIAHADAGDKAAAAQLCTRYFDGRGGSFDAADAASWCRQSATQNNAAAMHDLGMLTLAGVGMPKNIDQAGALCAQAQARDITVSAGFCLAAIAAERRRMDLPVQRPDAARAAADAVPDPAAEAAIPHWRSLADNGDHAAPAQLCAIYFNARDGVFDAARAASWCRRAASYGDARSLLRLGMMRLWGVGMEKSAADAEAMQVLASATAAPSAFAYPQPWSAATNYSGALDSLEPDRVMESVHTTPTGLTYNCRELNKYARYGVPPGATAFGRKLADFRAEDYAALNNAAEACATAIAPYDQNGGERAVFAAFQKVIPELQAQQHAQAAQAHSEQVVSSRQNGYDASQGRAFSVIVAFMSDVQSRCVDAVRGNWMARRFNPGANAMEIRSTGSSDADGTTTVSGEGRIVNDEFDENAKPVTYTCTFDDATHTLTGTSVTPSSATASQ
jgi:TPR repeat protein